MLRVEHLRLTKSWYGGQLWNRVISFRPLTTLKSGERSNTGKTVSRLAVDIQNMTPNVD